MLQHKFFVNPSFPIIALLVCFMPLLLAEVGVMAQSTQTPTLTTLPTTASAQLSIQATTVPTSAGTAPLLIFSTPPPMHDEEALSSNFRNVPSVFSGIDNYYAIQAQVATLDTNIPVAANIQDAIKSVVQILRCDQFGCETPVGTGVIVHPSGLILTAYHVLLEDPSDLRSPEYPNFVIALTEDVRTTPRPLYQAVVVADKNEQDIALLAIERTLDGELIETERLSLPALSFADTDMLFADTLHILGYPIDGGDSINYIPATFTSFNDNGQLIVVDKPLSKGTSGGPALALQNGQVTIAGLVIRGRSTQGRLEQEGILRAVDQITKLNWSPRFERVISQYSQMVERIVDGTPVLQIALQVSAFDLVDESLRLLFYVTDAETGHPWQLPNTDGPLTIWADVSTSAVIDTQTIQLTIPVAELGTTPNHLRFYAMLWDRRNGQSLWASTEAIELTEDANQAATTVSTTPVLLPTSSVTMTVNQEAASAIVTVAADSVATLVTATPLAAPRTAIVTAAATLLTQVPAATVTPNVAIHAQALPTETMTPTPQPGTTQIFQNDIVYVYIPAGEFLMGSSNVDVDMVWELCLAYRSNCERQWFEGEQPQHAVLINEFWLMQTEVTNAQYGRCVRVNVCTAPKNDRWDDPMYAGHPVTNVDWYQANTYAQWVGGRLPTEAEWEKACRGTAGQIYPWGNQAAMSNLLNYAANNLGDTVPVGTYQTGGYNLYDMAGNVWEWTNSENRAYPYVAKDGREGFKENAIRTLRGGSRADLGAHVRCAVRGRSSADNANDTFGFRVAR